MNPILSFLGLLVKPVTDAYNKRQDIKAAKDAIKAEILKKKVDNTHTIEVSDQHWEAIAAQKSGDTWKDEYVTIIITAPIPGFFMGGLLETFGYGSQLIDGIILGIQQINAVGGTYGFLLEATVLAALGLSIWRKL